MPTDPTPYLQAPVEEAVLLGRITQHVKDYGVLDAHGLWTLPAEHEQWLQEQLALAGAVL